MPSVTHLTKANKVQMEDQIVTLRDINGHGTIETLSKEDTLDNGQLQSTLEIEKETFNVVDLDQTVTQKD